MYRRLASLILVITVCLVTVQAAANAGQQSPVSGGDMLLSGASAQVERQNIVPDEYVSVDYSRIGGSDRVHTALLAARTVWASGSDAVILASSENYADALAGVPLSKALDAPILLSAGDEPESEVLAGLEALGAKKAYILGGSHVMSYLYERRLGAAGVKCSRIAGQNRFETAVKVANVVSAVKGRQPSSVLLVSSAGFADALSAGAAAAATDGVILYQAPDGRLNEETAQYLKGTDSAGVYVIGGSSAISSMVFGELAKATSLRAERIGGVDRYDTSLRVCVRFDHAFEGREMIAATGDGFADALAGSAVAARLDAPLLLANNLCELSRAHDYIIERRTKHAYVMGGQAAISDCTADELFGAAFVSSKTTVASTAPAALPERTRTAYLTFDDGPSENTTAILDILKEDDIKATFFVVHREGYEDVYRRIVEEGHTIALHSYSHDYAEIYGSEEAFYADLDAIAAYVRKVTGVSPMLMRFPGGSRSAAGESYCPGIMAALRDGVTAAGYRYFDWNVYTGDAAALTVDCETIVKNTKRQSSGLKRAMILLHDSPAKRTTVEALPEITEYLRSQGFGFLAIDASTEPIVLADGAAQE